MATNPVFHRLELLVGPSVVERLRSSRAIVFGVGGVGGWCAEALVRNGLGEVTVVDSDTVCVTNVNRQLQALTGNVGQSKVGLLAERLRSIHPRCKVEAIQAVYEKDTRDQFDLPGYDYVVDAIDSYTHKLDLIEHAWEVGATLVSSMGAACRIDSTAIRTASIWDARKDPFARIVRKGLRRRGFAGDFRVVYSEEDPLPPFEHTSVACGTHQCFCPHDDDPDRKDWCESKIVINGSAVHVTAAFGMALAGLVMQDARRRALEGVVPA
ncbi:MAG: tRNA threonylcarbamoyladenosine dehydratase [Fibrobacterota bacterium]|nr:tRNA threonylcarbamoyladenosine dehydratase [Fibrobacterota bacterium]QQS03353.1 MAG: tRNA threonylcarbamoyladenosine dehydratase [Fibrobacterota bacterium]